jgi:hypothetical protein
MSTCKNCGNSWDARAIPSCPACQVDALAPTNLVTCKHHPQSMSLPYDSFRSVVPWEFISGSVGYLQHFANHGTWFYSVKYSYNPCLISSAPLGSARGSAIPAHSTISSGTQNCFMIVDIGGSPHIYPQSRARFQQELKAGSYVLLPQCSTPGCINLVVPRKQKCVDHES